MRLGRWMERWFGQNSSGREEGTFRGDSPCPFCGGYDFYTLDQIAIISSSKSACEGWACCHCLACGAYLCRDIRRPQWREATPDEINARLSGERAERLLRRLHRREG